jgi:hypothetical protein
LKSTTIPSRISSKTVVKSRKFDGSTIVKLEASRGTTFYSFIKLYKSHTFSLFRCGFVEFFDTEASDKAVALNGTEVLGRQMRIDYASASTGGAGGKRGGPGGGRGGRGGGRGGRGRKF